MLRVGHDNSGSDSRWLLDEVVVYSLARGERYVFKGGRWIGGRNKEIDLPLGELLNLETFFLNCFLVERHRFNIERLKTRCGY